MCARKKTFEINGILHKICNHCDEQLPVSDFSERKSRGNVVLRSNCKPCETIISKEQYYKHRLRNIRHVRDYQNKNSEKVKARRDLHSENNRGVLAEKSRIHYHNNSEHYKAYRRTNVVELSKRVKTTRSKKSEYYKEQRALRHKQNPGEGRHNRALRRARVKRAVPGWYEHQLIKALYVEAHTTGMHVDHEIPLQNDKVCGLHCIDNLQLLTPQTNLEKSNAFVIT